MIEIRTLKGPLDDEQLGWITRLYGPTDPKYASLEFVRHQFVDNPAGWSAHTFAMDDGVAVGHTAIVPFRARTGAEPLVAGKIEAVVIAPEYRGTRTEDGTSLAVAVLGRAYAFGHECDIVHLFGLAPPRVSAVHARAGCLRLKVEAPTYVLVTHPGKVGLDWPRKQRLRVFALALVQNAVVALAYAAVRIGTGAVRGPTLRAPTDGDADLAVADPDPATWTVSGDEAWDWYSGSGVLSVMETAGRHGSRALLRYRAGDASSVQIVGWRTTRAGLTAAVLLLGASRRLARRAGAPTLRFQPWHGSAGDGALTRASRLFGLVPRTETELVLHAGEAPVPVDAIALTPFFYVTF